MRCSIKPAFAIALLTVAQEASSMVEVIAEEEGAENRHRG